jgi:hypothetical protein
MDGAAQAGMIMSRIMMMAPLSQYIIFAQYAPPTLPCDCPRSCCAGKKPNEFWEAVIMEISRASIAAATPGVLSYRVLRDAIIRKMFGVDMDIVDAADRCGLERRQAFNHQSAIKLWLDGAKERKGRAGVRGVRALAFEHINRILVDSGIVNGSIS